MKRLQKLIWDICLTTMAFLIIYGLFIAILGGFFVVFRVTYDSFADFLLYATVFFTIRFVTDWLFDQTSKWAVQFVTYVPAAVFIQLFISASLHFVIIYSLGWIVPIIALPLYIQIILAFGCSFVEVIQNGKWETIANQSKQ